MLNLFQALMPKESRFFDLFGRHAETLVGGAGVMSRMFAERQGIQEACLLRREPQRSLAPDP